MTLPLTLESNQLADYLAPSAVIDWQHRSIVLLGQSLTQGVSSISEQVRVMYEWVRDRISHTYDIGDPRVTCTASDVLYQGHGFCFAKAHLLAALLRSCGIPTGFCYQRLVFDDAQPDRFTLHGLNAVYLPELDRWVRLDARGNKPGVQAEFAASQEQLAFPIRSHWGEVDYPALYPQPHPKIITALQTYPTATALIAHLPATL
ncbi:transglutaminase-like domain-containing protein [Nodosilinea sp. E11]|uniref:transglutaminase-like domain-containing protein n=1 Tax=Nodosilinea sp. E11 TaxID=3037479 RepID=UPI0029341054|nr:transglutaminase-like domain-containing protein [Nodosilinea sp. E11]WOD40367.1 transglutaminase-like domain-containing protein [Nodosilinea sp. E11]